MSSLNVSPFFFCILFVFLFRDFLNVFLSPFHHNVSIFASVAACMCVFVCLNICMCLCVSVWGVCEKCVLGWGLLERLTSLSARVKPACVKHEVFINEECVYTCVCVCVLCPHTASPALRSLHHGLFSYWAGSINSVCPSVSCVRVSACARG